jgi:hypothetical protein
MNLVYSGSGRGISGDQMMASQVGAGSYNLVQAVVKGLAPIKALNSVFKDNSDEIKFDKIDGTLSMKNQVFSFTANTIGKVGAMRISGGVNSDGVYTPNMKIQSDIKKDFVDSDQVKGQIPAQYRDKVSLDWAADDNGNIPVDLNFTGKAAENHFNWDSGRLTNNVQKRLGKEAEKAAGQVIQQKAKDLGSQLKGLFGH